MVGAGVEENMSAVLWWVQLLRKTCQQFCGGCGCRGKHVSRSVVGAVVEEMHCHVYIVGSKNLYICQGFSLG